MEQSAEPKKIRIIFIDLMRAYAILMMVQGHTVGALLADEYRVAGDIIYSTWNFMRGITAPVFLFSAGAVFTYLLFRNGKAFGSNERVRKGLKRFLMLITIGYLLHFQLSIIPEMFGPGVDMIKHRFAFMSEALHCIGFAILFIIGIYWLNEKTKISISLLTIVAGLACFLFWPYFNSKDWVTIVPVPIAQFLYNKMGSSFPLIPWMGFAFFGAALGRLIARRPYLHQSWWLALGLLLPGILMHTTGIYLNYAYELTGWDNFIELYRNNFLFYRLGQVFIVSSIAIALSRLWQNIPDLILKIGRHTLMIYVVHIFIIYNTTISNGLVYYLKRSLGPWEVIGVALLLEVFFVLLVKYSEPLQKMAVYIIKGPKRLLAKDK